MSAPVSSAAAQNGSRSVASSVAADAARQRADHGARKTRRYRRLEHGGCARAVAKRHGRQRHEARLGFGCRHQHVVGEPAPAFAFGARQFIAEHVDPAAHDLLVDSLLGHPGGARGDIGQRLRHRPRRLGAGEGKGERAGVLDLPHIGKLARILADRRQQPGRHQMGVAIDDHLPRASAIRSPSFDTFSGSVLMVMPRGLSASLTALAIAAGAPR